MGLRNADRTMEVAGRFGNSFLRRTTLQGDAGANKATFSQAYKVRVHLDLFILL